MELDRLQEAVDRWLTEGPLAVEELADRAVKAGVLPPEDDTDEFGPVDAMEELLDRSDAYWTVHDRAGDALVVLTSSFLDTGMTFTHRVTAEELEAEAILVEPDLSVLDWGCRNGLALDDGGRVLDGVERGAAQLTGPAGWIDAVRPGDLLAFRRVDEVLSVEIIDVEELGDGARELAALRDTARRWIGDGRGEEEVPVVMEAMAGDPSLFRRPVPPVGELLRAAGLERRGVEWGWADEVWHTRQERFTGHSESIRRLYAFEACCDRALAGVEAAWLAHVRGEAFDARAVAGDLAHGAVAPAFVHTRAALAHAIAGFGALVAADTTGRHAAPALALVGLAHLRADDPLAAVDALEAAVAADPGFAAAAGELAVLELDRGNLARAHTLAHRDGADPELVQWIEDERARRAGLAPSAGRNDPCPCGSGKKFKRCCANQPSLPLPHRVPLILQRVAHFATGAEGRETLFGLAITAASDHDDIAAAIPRFLDDPFLVDVAVHEGGLGAAYLDQRAPLLADDEVALLEVLLDEGRRLWEIIGVTPGESLTLRDTRSGEELQVTEHRGSLGRETGELLLARATTVAGEPMLFGVPLLVPLRHREQVLAVVDGWVDADELASWFGALHLPPRITNVDGEDLVPRRTTLQIAGSVPHAVSALDESYSREGTELLWHDVAPADGDDVVRRGALRLDGSILIVETNSEERQERILAQLDELFEYAIVDDEILDDPDGGEDDDHAGLLPGGQT